MTSEERETELEILAHRIVGSWAIDYRVLMNRAALDEIERRLISASRAVAAAERERCAAYLDAKSSEMEQWDTAASLTKARVYSDEAAALRALSE